MRNASTLWMIIFFMVLLDIYVFQAIKALNQPTGIKWRTALHLGYWIFSIFTLLAVFSFRYVEALQSSPIFRTYVFAILVGILFAKLLATTAFMVDDMRRVSLWTLSKILPTGGARFMGEENSLPRSQFLSWLGLALGGTLFGSLLMGFSNKYKYQLKKIQLSFPNLPIGFDGLKLIHISDIHSGSFHDKAAVIKGVEMIMKEKPTLILFTGDLVNDRAKEMTNYLDVFNQLTAPMGVYSCLGNHDYGDYVQWDSTQAKMENLAQLKEVHKNLGWRLLMNEHILLEKDGDQIAILGIENWGAKGRFPKYGRMDLANQGLEKIPFKILLSHDPSHWDAEVIPHYPSIDLMLSGHTHGMQFGLENPYFKWSPVQWMYKQWAGLYEQGNQKLYVNRGFGFIGYPGRVGILPEISVITLHKEHS